jgi:hypothetical protein
MFKRIICGLLLGLIFLPYSLIAAAQQQIGTVIAVQGSVTAQDQAGNKRVLARRAPVFLNDVILTTANGKAQLKLNDDSLIALQPGTRYSVDQFQFNPREPQNNRYVANIVTGTLISISGQGRPDNYQLKGPLAAIVARGTGYAVQLLDNQKHLPVQQNVQVFEGYVDVTSLCPKYKQLCTVQTVSVGIGKAMAAVSVNTRGQISEYKGPSLLLTSPSGTTSKSAASSPTTNSSSQNNNVTIQTIEGQDATTSTTQTPATLTTQVSQDAGALPIPAPVPPPPAPPVPPPPPPPPPGPAP